MTARHPSLAPTQPPAILLGVVLLVALACGCGGASTGEPSTAAGEEAAPLTEADPPPYAPPPSEAPRAGEPMGAATAGGYDQARAVAIRVLEAVRDGDEPALERLLAPEVATMFPRLATHTRPREAIVRAVVAHPRRRGMTTDVSLEQLVDVAAIEVMPLSRRYQDEPIPRGMQGTDLIVSFPLQAAGRRLFQFLFGWPGRGGLVVRPGAIPFVVAI